MEPKEFIVSIKKKGKPEIGKHFTSRNDAIKWLTEQIPADQEDAVVTESLPQQQSLPLPKVGPVQYELPILEDGPEEGKELPLFRSETSSKSGRY